MDEKLYSEYILELEQSSGSFAVIVNLFKRLQVLNIDIDSMRSKDDVVEALCKISPKDKTKCLNLKTYFIKYFRWNDNFEAYKTVSALDFNQIWEENVKETINSRILTEESYNSFLSKLSRIDDHRAYVLVMALWEGIWNADCSVVTNLRLSDINNNSATLHSSTGATWDIAITDKLYEAMVSAEKTTTMGVFNWKSGLAQRPISGRYDDSIFKINTRRDSKVVIDDKSQYERYRNAYQKLLQKNTEEFFDRTVSMRDFFYSGVIDRLRKKLAAKGIVLEEACKSDVYDDLIGEHLAYYHWDISIPTFRRRVLASKFN